MSPETRQKHPEADARYHGFSLSSVCWGYRDIFERSIEQLLAEGLLGEGRKEVTERFFGLLKQADQSCYDHVLRRFLGAINPQTQWLLDLPGIFSDIIDLGHAYASERPHHGVTFFELLGRGGFGDTPAEVRHCLSQARRLREIDTDLSLAFLKGYRRLVERLDLREIDLYVEAGLASFSRNRRAGLAFLAGALESSEVYLQSLTRECRLQEVQPHLAALLKALTQTEVAVRDIGGLDTDDLIERGCHSVCLYRRLYLPGRVRQFDERRLNRAWYRLAAVVAAGALSLDSFSRIHGHADYVTCMDVVGDQPLALNVFLLIEWWRVLSRCRTRWPGVNRLLDLGLGVEFEHCPPACEADRLARILLTAGPGECASPIASMARAAASSVNVFQTASLITDEVCRAWRDSHPDLARRIAAPISFLPDFLFPGTLSAPPRDGLIADLREVAAGRERADGNDGEQDSREDENASGAQVGEEQEDGNETGVPACYMYDEWSHDEDDYLRDYCYVHETVPESPAQARLPADILEEGRRLSRVFERLKPDLIHKEKYLQDGDDIDPDRLLNYLVQRREDPSPRVDFYERPHINRRDLAVLILLDASGSTGEMAGAAEKIIDIERRAAAVLGQGLHTLGDRFAICGFNSNGRENCNFIVYKDFGENWEGAARQRVVSATPANSTRVGPALRHAGWRMSRIACRQRLIIVITDGRPMDTGYDPNTRYAQYDVRMACDENERQGIHTFAISTQENSIADMEIMFPARRFAILADIRRLPTVLPRLYTRLTV